MPELLLELLSEEIPARMQARAAEDLKRLVTEGLRKEGLDFKSAQAYVTPRRLALVVDGLPNKQPDVKEERKGPKVGSPEPAIKGFLGSVGLESVDQCEKREVKGKEFYFAVIDKKGLKTEYVLMNILGSTLNRFPWPKAMKWADCNLPWIRPLHNVLAIFQGKAIPFSIALKSHNGKRAWGESESNLYEREIPLTANSTTTGHRFHAPKPFKVKNFADYKSKLAHDKVVLDAAERRKLIEDQAQKLVKKEKLTLKDDPDLLDEVAGLVEWPVVLMGSIDVEFMDLWKDVLITVMRHHQKYFSVLDAEGNLAPRFVMVANTEAVDGGKSIVAGNERVLRARLADAKFFWDQDRRQPLESYVPLLKDLVFHSRLGSMADKAERIAKLARALAGYVGADPDRAERAGRLCKADLVTQMVREFPELQGVMGGRYAYYALKDGEDTDVAEAIAKHYAPLGPGDACPTAPVSVAVSLADKIDTLIGFFGIFEKPTGSKDPFALRRAALGAIRLIIENKLELPLFNVFLTAEEIYPPSYGDKRFTPPPEILAGDLLSFFADRLKVHLKEQGVRHDLIAAVFAVEVPGEGGEDDLVRLLARVGALKDFLDSEDGANLLVAYRRAANILRIEEKKDKTSYDGLAEENLLDQDEERDLFERLAAASAESAPAVRDERFSDAMSILARLRPPVDAFFDRVTVNCGQPELRINRLRLLSQIRSTIGGVADFAKIEG